MKDSCRKTFRKRSLAAGFSLIELLVVVAIFMIMTAVILYNQNKFSSDISISNVAYAVALQVRQAQVYGTLVRQSQSSSGATFDSAYGLRFSDGDQGVEFAFFADDDNDLFYSAGDSIIGEYVLPEGNVITDLCTYKGATVRCFQSSDDDRITFADIVFKRPEPRAIITDSSQEIDEDSGVPTLDSYRDEVQITITSSLGDRTRIVKVTSTGQISVVTPPEVPNP
jgi:prepilin-type N-terminal cleavage/methylation domain-containing protein